MSFASLGNVPPAVSDVVEAAEGDKPIAAVVAHQRWGVTRSSATSARSRASATVERIAIAPN